MESGLEDRNNRRHLEIPRAAGRVSMESGLEDRNNKIAHLSKTEDRLSQWSPA